MPRMHWADEPKAYQPRLSTKRINQLYRIGQLLNVPMTVAVDRAVSLLVSEHLPKEELQDLKDLAEFYKHHDDMQYSRRLRIMLNGIRKEIQFMEMQLRPERR